MSLSRFVLSAAAVLAAGITVAAIAAPQNTSTSDQRTNHSAATAPSMRSPIKPGDRDCVQDTGSLIKAKKGECLPVTGRSYSKQDIDNTGETTLGPALQKLDPSITVRGNGY